VPQLKPKAARELSLDDLESRLEEYRKEYLRLRTLAKRGTLNKESGKVAHVKRMIAMLETVKAEKRRESAS
jgi:ribosomal protein L29